MLNEPIVQQIRKAVHFQRTSSAIADGGAPPRDLLKDRRGASAVEFALLLPPLVALFIGVVDYGALTYQQMEVSAAAHAGADYAYHNGFNASAIGTAVTSATSLTVSASPAPAQETACVTNGAIVATNGSSCPSGGSPGTYVTVNAQATFTPIVAWASFAFPSTISAQAMVRIR